MTHFSAPDDFFSKTSKHCVALFLLKSGFNVAPNQNDLNATLTFVEYKGKTYGITCKHVVELLENKRSEGNNGYDFVILTGKRHILLDPFIFPPNDLFLKEGPDIAIRQICPDLLKAIGKIPINIESQPQLLSVKHAVAVGFPTYEKKAVDGNRIEMPCFHAIAEINSVTEDKLYLFSELTESPSLKSFNGMSGGPVFWTTDKDYALLGIMYDAREPIPPSEIPSDISLGGGPTIRIDAERITIDKFRYWLSREGRLTEDIHWVKSIKFSTNIQ